MTQRKLAKNVGVMSFAVLISRIFGLVRDQVMAYFFGTSYINDAFNVAYNLPNLLRRLFGEGALSAAFVPIYTEIGIKDNRKAQIEFALNVLSLLTFVLTVLTLIGLAIAPWLVKLLYPGLPPQTTLMAIKLSRIIFPYLFFIGLSSTMIAILNSHDYFFMTGLSSALLNLGMIFTVIAPALVFNLSQESLAVWSGWGVFLGGFLQTAVNLPYLKRIGYNLRVSLRLGGQALTALWKRFIPAMIGIGIREINLLADAIIASFLPIGSISALSFGNRLMQLPLGIFGIATGTAVLPLYSRHVASENWQELSDSLRFAMISLSLIMLPITMLIINLGADAVELIFQRGVFDTHATWMTSQALLFYSLGLLFYSLNQTITPLFYANRDTRTPVKIAGWMVGLNIVLNLILMQFLQHRGLALATSLTACVNFLLMLHLIRKKLPAVRFARVGQQIGRIVLASGLMWCFSFALMRLVTPSGNLFRLLADTTNVVLSLLLYYIALLILRVEYISQFRQTLWSRFRRR